MVEPGFLQNLSYLLLCLLWKMFANSVPESSKSEGYTCCVSWAIHLPPLGLPRQLLRVMTKFIGDD